MSSWQRLGVATVVAIILLILSYYGELRQFPGLGRSQQVQQGVASVGDGGSVVPLELLGTVYNETDFVNPGNIHPPFWACKNNSCSSSKFWGPCYPPRDRVDWTQEIEYQSSHPASYRQTPAKSGSADQHDLRNLCRPGFLIIGAGKCGTRYDSARWIRCRLAVVFLTVGLALFFCSFI
jgi:hypothetical protein